MADATFEVIDTNRQFNFARVKSANGDVLRCELFPEQADETEGEEQLQVGDRVTGLVRGENLHRVSMVRRAPPPAELLAQLESTVQALRSYGLTIDVEPMALAQLEWRSRLSAEGVKRIGLREVVLPQLTFLFDYEKVHPSEDATLVPRFQTVMQRWVPQFQLVVEEHSFRLEPGGNQVVVGTSGWITPTGRYEPLIAAANQMLAAQGVAERWHRLPEDWVLATPELMQLLLSSELLLEPEEAPRRFDA